MSTIRDCPTEELRNGIMRCRARLAGIMSMGILDRNRVEEALKQYRDELRRRGENAEQELF
jgi:hypothetical protein